MLNQLTHESFIPYLAHTFQLNLETANYELTLLEATIIDSDPEEGRRHPFSVVFLGPSQPILPQQIYELHHEEMGSLALFLVPIGPDKTTRGIRYEAVFT